MLKFQQDPASEFFDVRVIRHATVSPDESKFDFSALGYVWIKELPEGRPRKLTPDDYFAFEPAFSPDGKQLTFVSWHDENRGAVWKMSVSGRRVEKLTKKKGIYRNPFFSPDESKILYRKEDGNMAMGLAYDVKPGIYLTDAEGNEHHFVIDEGINPGFNTDGNRIYYQRGGYMFGSLDKSYRSVNLEGNDERTHFHSKYANQYAVSPDNKWLAFGQLHSVYLMSFIPIGKTFELSAESDNLPVRKVSEDSGINLNWSADGQKLYWTLGDTLYKVGLQDVFSFVEGAPDSIPEVEPEKLLVGLQADFDDPTGRIALTGATIISMAEDSVIENGVVLVEGNRIADVGSAARVNIPGNAKVYDLDGKYILPGYIDTHAHLNAFRYGLSPQKDWPYYANLAYGITATHDPSSMTEMSLSQSEMVKAGRMTGPRIFTTGTILYGAEGDYRAVINSLEHARSAIRRTAAYGTFTVKSYNQPRRDQRQQVIQAAKEQQVMVYPEAGSTFFHNMTMILDGHTGVEHNIPVAPLYDDVVQLWAASETANTPTLIVSYGSISGEYYWYQHTNVWENEKLLTFTPRSVVDSRARHRTMSPEAEYENGHIPVAKSLKKLWDQGVSVCVGGHGQLQGLGYHWEMWILEQGGFTLMEVLQAVTLEGAKYIWMKDDLGSLEPGKLADLVVLDENSLVNIRNTTSVTMTMANGHLYEAGTMNEIGNHPLKRSRFYWEMDGSNSDFDWHIGTYSGQLFRCLCGQ